MGPTEELIRESFALSPMIRYIAVYADGELTLRQRDQLANASSGESDQYEELLVNPTLIKLASQRGNIDCGGLEYFIVRYGHFFVLLFPTPGGHVNYGIEPEQDPMALVEGLKKIIY